MSKIDRFEELKCWQESRILVKIIFQICSTDKLNKDFDLKSQIKRAALSTMNNIAEGFARFNKKEFIHFLNISQSSASEVKSMLYVLEDLNYLNKDELKDIHNQVDSVRFLTLAFIKHINKQLKVQVSRSKLNEHTA